MTRPAPRRQPPDIRMSVPLGGASVRLKPADQVRSCGFDLNVNEARWLVVVLATLSGSPSPVADLQRSLTIALARRGSCGGPVDEH